MDNAEIKLKCLDLATRDTGVAGFVGSRIINSAKQFYEWVIEEEKPLAAPQKSPGRPKKAR